MSAATSGMGFGAPSVRPAPVASVAPPQDAAASPPDSPGVEVAPAPGGAVVPGTDGTAASDAAREPAATSAAQEAVPPPEGEEGGQGDEAPPGGLVEDCGEMVPAKWGDDDPRLTRAFIASKKRLAAADLARGRDTTAARDAMRAASIVDDGDAWERNQRVSAVCRKLVEQGGCDLEKAAAVLRRLGFAIYNAHGGGFLAIGWEPETVEGASDWQRNWDVIGWVFDCGPEIGRRGEVDCSYEQVTIEALRSMLPSPHNDSVRILRIDASEAWGATTSDTEREWDGVMSQAVV